MSSFILHTESVPVSNCGDPRSVLEQDLGSLKSAVNITCMSSLWSAMMRRFTKLKMSPALSFLAGPRSPSHQGFVRPSETPVSAADEMPACKLDPATTDITAKRHPQTWDRSLADRKLWLLKRSGLFGEDTKGAEIVRASNIHDLRGAYKLVHDVYLGTGFIEPEKAGMRLRIFETTPEMATFVAKVDDRVVGVLSILADTPELGLPSDAAFRVELDALRASGQRICEITNQAVAKDHRKSAVPTELMRCAMAHATVRGCDEIVATVSPSHGSFYELLGFREIGSERTYSEKLHDPVVTLGMRVDQYRFPQSGLNETERFIHRFLAGENHYLPLVAGWDAEARKNFLDADLLLQLFGKERNFISECSETELSALHIRWGSALFAKVTTDLFVPSQDKLVETAMPVLAVRPEECPANGELAPLAEAS